MAGILKVDDLRGNTSAGDITITSEGGSATMQLQQGVAKCWTRFNPSSNTEIDSLNQSSRTDDGTGRSTINFTNNMNKDDFVTHHTVGNNAVPVTGSTGAYVCSSHLETTSKTEVAYGFSGNDGGTTWALYDYPNQKSSVLGDLA